MIALYVDPDRQRKFAALDRLLDNMAVPHIKNGRYKPGYPFMVSIGATVV